MSDEIKINRPVQQNARPEMQPSAPVMGEPRMPAGSKSKLPWIILGVVVVVLIVLGVLFRDKLMGSGDGEVKGTVTGKASGYQAVFLTNGQVYFGKVSNPAEAYLTLKDIYYLQVVQPPLQGQQQPGQQAADQQAQISLVKLGNELHGPVDEMHINREQILFYEDLKEDGQVVKAIRDYKANPSGQPAQ